MVNDLRSQISTAVQTSDWPALMRAARKLENVALDFERQAFSNDAVQPWCSGASEDLGKCYLVTGGAGFIGSHLVRRLLDQGHRVFAIDEFNDYYDPVLKWENVADLLGNPRFTLKSMDIRDLESMRTVFAAQHFDVIIHLAARAGVRPSIVDPQLYVTVNVLGTQNLLELAREFGVGNFVYASSSSVYGGNTEFPFAESQNVDNPISPYAATKKANEVQSACYSRLYNFPVSGLRFFTVYGPSGRPDMAIRMFIEKMDSDEPIPMYGDGSFERDFTYVDDIVSGILGVTKTAEGKQNWIEVFNLGESDTTTLRELILLIAKELGKIETAPEIKELSIDEQNKWIDALTARGLIKRLPEQLGDVRKTYADVTKSRQVAGYDPRVKIAEGIRRTVEWHRAMQRASRSPERERIRAALSLNSALRLKAGLDSAGRPKDPCYSSGDARHLSQSLGDIGAVLDRAPRDFFALRAQCELAATLTDVAAYLGGAGDKQLCRMNGLALWRKRREIISIIRAGGVTGIRPNDETRLLTLAKSVVAITGAAPVAVVVAAAGLGTRIADEVGGYEMKHRVFLGDEMILLSLRNVIPFSRRIVAVVSERNRSDVQALIERSEMTADRGFRVDYVVQKDRMGDGDAHLTAQEVLADFPGIIVFVFADAPTKSPQTIEKMILLKQALGPDVPLVVPCFLQDKPYSPIVLSERGVDRGRVLWNWQKADEEDYPEAAQARQREGLRNVGMFAAETSVFASLQRFKREQFTKTGRYKRWERQMADFAASGAAVESRPKDPEFGFADLMKILPGEGIEVAAACLALPRDRLNVNKVEDIDEVNALLKETCPQVQPMVETSVERHEIIVRFYDADTKGAIISLNGLTSIRNYTRFLVDARLGLDAPEVSQRVAAHIEALTRRIETDLGLKVLPLKYGVAD